MIVSLGCAGDTIHKVATTAEEAARLDREAVLLGLARHPGVVRLRGSRPAALEVIAVAGWCLSDVERMPPAEVAGIGCAIATVLADLHHLGIVHGSVEAGHVLLDSGGRPVLCSLGQGRFPGSETGPEPEDDVEALIQMLLALLPSDPAEPALAVRLALCGRRPFRWRRLPTARLLATRLAAVPGAVLPDPAQRLTAPSLDPAPSPPPGPAPVRRRARSAFGAAGVAVAAGAFLLVGAPHRSSGPHIICPPVDRGCGPVDHRDGVVASGGGRFSLDGASGDPVVLGRWTCGSALPALLRLDRGDVWVFDHWPAGGAAVAARLAGRVQGAETLRVVPGAHGCDRLSVVRHDGAPTTLPAKLS